MKRFEVMNETIYPNNEVRKIVRWVMKYLELEQTNTLVKVKHHRGKHAYQGRFYPRPDLNGFCAVPWHIEHLIVARIGKPGVYPCSNHVYPRKDSPGTWWINDWQEALVCIMAHEAMHLRQHITHKGGRGRFSEVETEWAAFRLHGEWLAERSTTTL